MKSRWYKPDETKSMACPLSVGQAEAGRYTFCVNESCMAWQWLVIDDGERRAHEYGELIPQGWAKASEVYEIDGGKFFDIIKKPTHGRCGMVPYFGDKDGHS
jgi:hypothetical protein